MKTWVVRFVSLYVFNLLVLWVIGALTPARVGWAAFWASVILTAATIWLKPLLSKLFTGAAKKSAGQRTAVGERLVQYGIVFIVELVIWILVVALSGVRLQGWFWGWIIPPVILLIAWIVYDLIDDRIQARAGALYDQAQAGLRGGKAPAAAPPEAPSAATQAGREELKDGLTAEQRKMLDDLGS